MTELNDDRPIRNVRLMSAVYPQMWLVHGTISAKKSPGACQSFITALPMRSPTLSRSMSIRTGLPGGSPQSHVFHMILEGTRRRRAARSGFPPPWDKAA